MALDERDYMRRRAQRIMQEHYYRSSRKHSAPRGWPFLAILLAWVAVGGGLFWMFKALGY